MKEPIKTLTEWERVAFDYEPAFLECFCNKATMLVSVHWSSEEMKIAYVKGEGEFIKDTIAIDDWLEFYNSKK